MTPRTPQCKVFWALLSNSKHSGVPEDSKSPTLEVLGFTPTLGQSGVATRQVVNQAVETLANTPKQEERKLNLCLTGFEAKEGEIEKEPVQRLNTKVL